MRGLMAAALLSGELSGDERINTALFGAAFEEIDSLRQQIGVLPKDIEAATAKFRGANVQAVDDFVSVANEALSKFMLRTGEMKDLLGEIQQSNQQLLKSRGLAAPGHSAAVSSRQAERPGAVVIGLAFGGGMVSATLICMAMLAYLGK